MVVIERSLLTKYPSNANVPPSLDTYRFPSRPTLQFSSEDSRHIKTILMHLAVIGNNDPITTAEQPPSYLMHQMQVITVAEELMRKIDPDTAGVVAGTHDLGRSRNNDESHIPIGYDIAIALNLPREIANIALLHHQWGLGIEPFGTANFHRFADIEEGSDGLERLPYLSAWKESLGTDNEVVFLASLATLIADNSKGKTYAKKSNGEDVVDTNGNRLPFPFIAFFDKQQGLDLIRAQFDKKSYEPYSETHWRELAGMTFVLNCIEYFQQKTGVSYQASIHHAIDRYKQEVEPEMFRIWKDIYRGKE